ncbi:MAG: ATP-binding cassette domain-containing protein [Pseudonocardiaceae bacterium]|nr:ATP-binding cassette domain-containing protein [Pseudonocardiaceae bacterium]
MSLRVRELVAGYRRGTVLHGVDLDVGPGQAVALLGRNGAGKSTLVMTVMGLLRARSGSVRVDGHELAGARPHRMARAGCAVVPQGRRLWAPLTVGEHLELAARQGRRRGGSWTVERIVEALPRLGERRRQAAGRLSGGEQQMLAIARALLTNPRLVLLDEPSEGLAPAVAEQVAEVVTSMLADGVAVLLVEQDLYLAFSVADQVAVMQRGRIVHRASTPEFRRDPGTAHRLLGVS